MTEETIKQYLERGPSAITELPAFQRSNKRLRVNAQLGGISLRDSPKQKSFSSPYALEQPKSWHAA